MNLRMATVQPIKIMTPQTPTAIQPSNIMLPAMSLNNDRCSMNLLWPLATSPSSWPSETARCAASPVPWLSAANLIQAAGRATREMVNSSSSPMKLLAPVAAGPPRLRGDVRAGRLASRLA